jgi:lipid A 3-O-deacylase
MDNMTSWLEYFTEGLGAQMRDIQMTAEVIGQNRVRQRTTYIAGILSRFARCSSLVASFAILTCLALAGPVRAQQPPSTQEPPNSLVDGRDTWDLGAFLGGGTGGGKSSDTQFLFAGGRAGRVLTPDLVRNSFLRGNFEYAVEVMPVYTVFTPSGVVYGASIKPFVFRWNFTANQRVVPYLHVAGGVLFTTSDVPPPNTSSINFTPQIGGGIHYFLRPDRSFDFDVDVVHHSNASLGDHNPGYNASVFFSVGYSWYKHPK